MIITKTDLWTTKAKVVIFTGNSYVTKKGELVMGRGAAAQAKAFYPKLPKALGERISHLEEYNLLAVPGMEVDASPRYDLIAAFQVKIRYDDAARLDVIDRSIDALEAWLPWLEMGGYKQVAMNFPGIGAGKLASDEEKIREMLERLPDSVWVHKK